MLNNVIDLLFVSFFFYSLLLGIYGLLGNVVTLKKKQTNKQNGEDVTILLLRDTVTASWRAYVRASFRIKVLLLKPPS